MVHLLSGVLLRAHVVGRAHGLAGDGGLAAQVTAMGDAEVGEDHAPVLVQQDVVGLHVPVHHALAAGELQRPGHLAHHPQALAQGQARARILEAFARDELHGDVMVALVDPGVVDGDDVGVGQAADDAGLAQETLGEGGVGGKLGGQHLERHLAPHAFLDGEIDHGHAAPPQHVDDPVAGDGEGGLGAGRLAGMQGRLHDRSPSGRRSGRRGPVRWKLVTGPGPRGGAGPSFRLSANCTGKLSRAGGRRFPPCGQGNQARDPAATCRS